MCGSDNGGGGGNDEPERPVPVPTPPPPRPRHNPVSTTERRGPPMAEVPAPRPVPTPTPSPRRHTIPSHTATPRDDSDERRGPPMAEVPVTPPAPIPVPTPPPPRPYQDRPMSHGPSTSAPSSVTTPAPVTSASDGSVVRDSSGRPVMTVPVTPERTHEEIHKDPDPVLNNDNLTPEEEEDQNGRRYSGRKGGKDSRKTRLTILRTNPSVAVGSKGHRTSRPSLIPSVGINK